LSVAFSLYTDDWSGYLPGPGGLRGDLTYWSQLGRGGLENYIRQRGLRTVWCCPLTPDWHGPFPPRSYSMNSYLRTPPDVPYPTCVTWPTCLGCQQGTRVDKIQKPEQTILLFEGMPLTDGQRESLDYLYRCANWTKVRGFTDNVADTIDPGNPWHGKFNNYVYCDGHITARRPGRVVMYEMSPGQFVETNLATGKEMYQWWVDKNKFIQDWNNGVYRNSRWE